MYNQQQQQHVELTTVKVYLEGLNVNYKFSISLSNIVTALEELLKRDLNLSEDSYINFSIGYTILDKNEPLSTYLSNEKYSLMADIKNLVNIRFKNINQGENHNFQGLSTDQFEKMVKELNPQNYKFFQKTTEKIKQGTKINVVCKEIDITKTIDQLNINDWDEIFFQEKMKNDNTYQILVEEIEIIPIKQQQNQYQKKEKQENQLIEKQEKYQKYEQKDEIQEKNEKLNYANYEKIEKEEKKEKIEGEKKLKIIKQEDRNNILVKDEIFENNIKEKKELRKDNLSKPEIQEKQEQQEKYLQQVNQSIKRCKISCKIGNRGISFDIKDECPIKELFSIIQKQCQNQLIKKLLKDGKELNKDDTTPISSLIRDINNPIIQLQVLACEIQE